MHAKFRASFLIDILCPIRKVLILICSKSYFRIVGMLVYISLVSFDWCGFSFNDYFASRNSWLIIRLCLPVKTFHFPFPLTIRKNLLHLALKIFDKILHGSHTYTLTGGYRQSHGPSTSRYSFINDRNKVQWLHISRLTLFKQKFWTSLIPLIPTF